MTDSRHRTTLGNRFRFLVRALGLTGILLAPAGYAVAGDSLPWPAALTTDALKLYGEQLLALAQGSDGLQPQVGTILFVVGVVAVVLLLLHEVFAGLFLASGRKTAVGTNGTLQIGLAALLLVVVNAVSFQTHKRFDLTRYRQFTLPSDLVDELKKLRPDSPTTVVVLQLHKTAGTLSDKPDAYDGAAERKVVEKVTDLVAQLREFGPRFNVAVLDVQDEGYERQLKDLTDARPGLREAIAAAPENSLFFYADGRPAARPAIARMSFTDFYQLDKTASKEATTAERDDVAPLAGGLAFAPGVRGRGNLVLLPRGPAAFVRKVLSLEERKPKVGLAVIHPLLTSREGYEEYSAGGLRKALEANGFEVSDVILKRWGGRSGGGPTPAADTFEEYEIDRVESRYNLAALLVADRERQIAGLTELAGKLKDIPLATLDRQFGRQLGRPIRTEADRALIRLVFDNTIQVRREELAEFNKALAELAPKYREVFANERAAEGRRQTDVKAKLSAAVADCDLLIVPRLTAVDLTRGDIIPPNLFNLAKEQAEVVKEFLGAGKPVLFAVGPTNVERRGGPPGGAEPDDVEKLLPQLGIELGKQTILTPVEAEAMAERQNEALGLSGGPAAAGVRQARPGRQGPEPGGQRLPHHRPGGGPEAGAEEGRVPAGVRQGGRGRHPAVRRRVRVQSAGRLERGPAAGRGRLPAQVRPGQAGRPQAGHQGRGAPRQFPGGRGRRGAGARRVAGGQAARPGGAGCRPGQRRAVHRQAAGAGQRDAAAALRQLATASGRPAAAGASRRRQVAVPPGRSVAAAHQAVGAAAPRGVRGPAGGGGVPRAAGPHDAEGPLSDLGERPA